MSEFIHSLTLICPESKIHEGNQLAACWGQQHPSGNLKTFTEAATPRGETGWVSLKRTVCTPALLQGAASPPERHPADTDNQIDMDAAQRAYDALVILWPEAKDYQWPETIPDNAIIAVVDVPLPVVAERLGLTRSEPDAEELV